ncbi:Putative SAM-dependent methyltransferase RsmB/NOP2-type, RNA (C5-cytosine) methyltransferase [Septoria linicola]|uniref:NOL1/NOP2/Sun domain family member 4 n=1 Tax=Septoria linicola TaxID=215465 RepID=A0A9Q9B8A2_9PEZI|nr:putative SAM-dependent methyltransferase RsmB/NOP2-type, RNA (C5-cytosine) methyltransferase [Septoria linicola]USW58896.1 Putative SAM-dependent methyltransferase RsmB/NOP2-type, RNA (C5-cytosine) methyltransferase [Septoria linicola]
MTKTHRKAATSSADAFDRHYAAIWGEERWKESLRPALERPTRYACLLNRYVPLDASSQQISHADTQQVPIDLLKINGQDHLQGQAPYVVVRSTKAADSSPTTPSDEPFPAPVPVAGQLHSHWNLDAASVLVAHLLNVQHGDNVLDLCAAPGGKSISLAQNIWAHNHADDTEGKTRASQQRPLRLGTLHSNEADTARQRRLAENLRSYLPKALFDAQHVSALRVDGTNPKAHYELVVRTPDGTVGYDRVLVDAPCSSERHIVHAHVNARLGGRDAPEMVNWRPGSSKRLAETQLKLLMTGLRVAKVGATIVYATCSIEPTENDNVIEKILSQVEKERKKGIKWTVKVGFGAGQGDAALETELEKSWAERTKYGWIVLPDHPGGGRWGPLFFSVLTKMSGA